MLDLSPLIAAFMLGVEQQTWQAGPKETHVREHLGISLLNYYQRLNALLDTELALQLDPITTTRLRRIRETRRLVG